LRCVGPLAMESEVIASREKRRLFVSDAVDLLFYSILKDMKILGNKVMDYFLMETIACYKGYREWQAVEPLRIGIPALPFSQSEGLHFALVVDLRVDEDQVRFNSD